MTTAVKSPKRPATAPRADTSLEAIAKRRDADEAAVASGLLEGCTPNQDTAGIHEQWVQGAISSEECTALLHAAIRARLKR